MSNLKFSQYFYFEQMMTSIIDLVKDDLVRAFRENDTLIGIFLFPFDFNKV